MEVKFITKGICFEKQLDNLLFLCSSIRRSTGLPTDHKESFGMHQFNINWMADHGKNVEDWLQRQVDSISSRLEDLLIETLDPWCAVAE